MTAVGKWMDVNAEAIRATNAAEIPVAGFDGRITRKGAVHYVHLFKRPQDGILKLPIKASKATMLAGGKTLQATTSGTETTITLPESLPDAIATVIRVE